MTDLRSVYAASLANLHYDLCNLTTGIELSISGYNEKQEDFLDFILDRLTNFTIKSERFSIMKERVERMYKNFQTDQPDDHCSYYNSYLLNQTMWHNDDCLAVLASLTEQDLRDFIPKLFSTLHIECFVFGNSSAEQAVEFYRKFTAKLSGSFHSRPLLPSQRCQLRDLELQPGSERVFRSKNSVHQSHALLNYFQCGPQQTRENMLLELTHQIIKEACFDQLRTKEQLGYIVSCRVRRFSSGQGLAITVQSEKPPHQLDQRIENFLRSTQGSLREMEDSEFNQHVSALATLRLEKPKTLTAKYWRYQREIIAETYQFDKDEVEVALLRQLTKSDIETFYQDVFLAEEKRRKLSCEVLSLCRPDTVEEGGQSEGRLVRDIVRFKSSLAAFPTRQPAVALDTLRRETKIAFLL